MPKARQHPQPVQRLAVGFTLIELLVTIGVLAALGQAPLLEIQFRSALERGELTEEQVREIVLHLAHYIGWPLSTGVNAAAEKIIAQWAKQAAADTADTKES